MRVLFLAPHGDEAHVGAGGTIARLVDAGSDEIYIMAFSSADKSLPAGHGANRVYHELKRACEILDVPGKNLILAGYPTREFPGHRQEILQKLIDWRDAHTPDVVFLPSPSDIHQDHAVIATEGTRAFRKASSVYGYDLAWNLVGAESPNLGLFVELSKDQLERKMKAVGEFKSQQGKRNNCTTPEYAHSLAVVRGNMIERPYAEAFEVIREVRRSGHELFG